MAGQVEFLARLEPAVLAAHHAWGEGAVERGPGQNASFGCGDLYPVALRDAARRRGVRMQLELRIRGAAAQAGDLAVLRLAEVQGLGAREGERELVGEVGAR